MFQLYLIYCKMTPKEQIKHYIENYDPKTSLDVNLFLEEFCIFKIDLSTDTIEGKLAFLREFCKKRHGIDIKSRKRKQIVVYCRFVVINWLKENSSWTYYKIGKYFNGSNHTTIINAVKKHEILMQYKDYQDLNNEIINSLI